MTGAGYDVERIRSHFPALREGAAHFDGPGGSQTPAVVARAVADTLTSAVSNRGTVTPAERRADEIVVTARAAVADLLGADARGIVFGRSATELTFQLARTLSAGWTEGDEVVVTRLDHDANVRPWVIAAQDRGATVRFADFDPATGELDPAQVEAVVGERTRLVAVTAASNLIGTRPDLPVIADVAHGVGALLWVDGVHATAHVATDLPASGADFWVCSPYKFLGPHLGVLAARPELLETLRPAKLLPSSDAVPERFELGTLPYELLAGTTAAVEFLAGLDAAAVGSRRERLLASFDGARGPRGRPAGPAGSRDPRAARCHRVQQRTSAHPDGAVHARRTRPPGRPRPAGRAWRQRARRALLRVGVQPAPRPRRRRWGARRSGAVHERGGRAAAACRAAAALTRSLIPPGRRARWPP